MTNAVATRGVHHVTLTVTDVQRSREFYTTILNFQPVAEVGPRILLSNGGMGLVIGRLLTLRMRSAAIGSTRTAWALITLA